ncbi:MAG: hypothetical protein P8Y54_10240 [Xanthomonadales bacterium]
MRALRRLSVPLMVLVASLVSACDFWPRDLESLAESISREVPGEVTAWLIAGDGIVIDVANSPLDLSAQSELETRATVIAERAIADIDAPLEFITVTFHAGDLSDDPAKMREFIFLVMEHRPVLQPNLDVDATGPLTPDEVQAAIERLGDSVNAERRACALAEATKRAQLAGDPETLDPANVDMMPAGAWNTLDAFGKRIFLAQALVTEALFVCARP